MHGSATVPQHTVLKRWVITSPETLWAPHAGYATGSFTPKWQHSTEDTEKKVINTEQAAKRYYDRTVHPLSDIQQGSQVVLQNPTTKLWDMYGVNHIAGTMSELSQAKC